mmetsp:Transcript_11206/g.19139  ORF Transcript_11206/g.19139 Transcript_11206/m.19139 type:complete len:270 (+) Transcript_11206:97-906(+)
MSQNKYPYGAPPSGPSQQPAPYNPYYTGQPQPQQPPPQQQQPQPQPQPQSQPQPRPVTMAPPGVSLPNHNKAEWQQAVASGNMYPFSGPFGNPSAPSDPYSQYPHPASGNPPPQQSYGVYPSAPPYNFQQQQQPQPQPQPPGNYPYQQPSFESQQQHGYQQPTYPQHQQQQQQYYPQTGQGGPPQNAYAPANLDQSRERARQAFRQFDKDHSGYLDINEFLAAMNTLGVMMARDDALAVFALVDENKNQTISENEFLIHYISNYCGHLR